MWWWDVHSSRGSFGKWRIFALFFLVAFHSLSLTADAQAIRCTFSTLGPEDSEDDLALFKRHEIGSTVNGNNPKFIEAVLNGLTKAKLFFHLDNAVLKKLNDRYFKDQELSAAVESLYTRKFFENLNAEPVLKAELVYSDYKTIRLGFEHDTEEIRSALERVYEKTAADFVKELAEVPSLRKLYSKGDGLVADPVPLASGRLRKNSRRGCDDCPARAPEGRGDDANDSDPGLSRSRESQVPRGHVGQSGDAPGQDSKRTAGLP